MSATVPSNGMVESPESLLPHTHVWNTTYAFITSMSLNCAVELGIPEAIHGRGVRPVSLAALAADIALPPSRARHLGRLMRMLVHAGYFAYKKTDDDGNNAEEGYVLTPSSAYLLNGGAAFVKAVLYPAVLVPHLHLGSWFRNEDEQLTTPFHVVNEAGLWEYAARVAEYNTVFNAGITHDAELAAANVVSRCGSIVQGARSMVDVGGGNGGLAKAMAKAFPHLQCTVLDLPHVIATCKTSPTTTSTDEKVTYVDGDMFEYVPPADVAFLKVCNRSLVKKTPC